MKLLQWHCKQLKYRDTIKPDRPCGIRELIGEKTSGTFNNILGVFTCIEHGDSDDEVSQATESVISTRKMLGDRQEVVILPFAHLSSNLASPKVAAALLKHFVSSLTEQGVKVYTVSFGYNKEFELQYCGYGHPGSVSFRSFPRM